MTFGKRQLLIGAMVVALGAAVYLNWQFSGAQPVSVADDADAGSKQLGQTVYVNTEVSGQTKTSSGDESGNTAEENSTAAQTAAAVSGEKQADEPLAAERKKRAEAHKAALDPLKEIADSDDTSENAKLEAVRAAEELAAAIKTEGDIEAEIRAKGFSDCLVSINNGSCTVILPEEGLDDASVITVKDIVNRQANIDFDNITVSPYVSEDKKEG